ncbi:MAG TPA: ComEC/Rec2 family competence protein [Intrasporangium sp.]|uniref:ComEC/Rec2 family competence protein n=1 Tax=Intrasporangium sp. TaxID=1925024 RepID=UPI002D7A3C7E|nr:ComEC/Rec2 family competence protein [Intrasporangium sp.]HET7397982.1 ComEC/Rec2 family competence protein [Intrasporangium sp.]
MRRPARRTDVRLLVPALAAWPLVAFGALVVPVAWVVGGAVACGAAALVLLGRAGSRRRPVLRLLALTLAACCLALVATSGQRVVRAVGPLESLAAERAVVTLRGQVSADPRIIGGAAGRDGAGPGAGAERSSSEQDGVEHDGGEQRDGTGKAGSPSLVVVRLDVGSVTARGRTTQVSTRVLVLGPAAWADVEWHDGIEVVARLRPAEPGDDVVAVAAPRGPPQRTSSPGAVFRAASAVRARFREATTTLPADARGLVPALVLGDTSRTPPDLTTAMLATGMSHLSAVSGSNVTLVLGSAIALCRLLAVRRRWRPWAALGVLIAFVVLARPEPSVIRAAVMGGVGLLGLSTSRRRVGVPALAAAILVLLAWDPWLARSYGFALSSVATLGLLLFAQPWGSALARRLPPRLRWLGPVVAVPVAAQAACAPIVVPLQGSVSLVAVVANLLAAPLVGPTTVVGVGVAVLSVVWPGAATVLSWAAGVPAQGIAWVARRCAEAPLGSIPWGTSAEAAVLLAALTALVVLVAPWLWHRSRLRPLLAVAVVLVTAAFVLPPSTVGWPPPAWITVACDVGEGDGLVVNSGAGHAVVIDTGTEPDVIDGCLTRLHVEVVDLVVLTHFHADHAGGLAGVLHGRRVAEIRVSTVKEPLAQSEHVSRLAAAAAVPLRELRAGDTVTVGPVRADVWWPGRPISAGSVPNNGSVVMTVRTRGVGILFPGDMEREAAAEVLRAARLEPERWGTVDVLKVPHHGSSNRDDGLLRYVAGRLALISVGTPNDYGHPAPSTLNALARNGFRVHRTDLEGDLVLVRDVRGLTVIGRGRGP